MIKSRDDLKGSNVWHKGAERVAAEDTPRSFIFNEHGQGRQGGEGATLGARATCRSG